MPRHLRIHLGNVSDDAEAQVLAILRPLYRSDDIAWYTVEASDGNARSHPRSPRHPYTEIEGGE